MHSRRHFLRNCALGGAASASMLNMNCSCECSDAGGTFFVMFLLGFLANGPKSIYNAWLEDQRSRCADEERLRQRFAKEQEEAFRKMSENLNPVPFTPAPFPTQFASSSQRAASYSDTNVRQAVLAGPQRLWLLDTYSNPRVRLVNTTNLQTISDIPLPGEGRAFGLDRSFDRTTVYVTRNLRTTGDVFGPLAFPSAIFSINATTNAITPFIEFPGRPLLQNLWASPDGRWLIATSEEAVTSASQASPKYIHFIDVSARRIANRLEVQELPDRCVFTPDGQLAFGLSTLGLGLLTVIDPASQSILRTLNIPGAAGPLGISPQGDRLYIAESYVAPFNSIVTARMGIAIVDTSSLDVVGYIPYTDPGVRTTVTALAVHPTSGYLYFTFRGQSTYTTAHPGYREIDAAYRPTTETVEQFTHILIG